MSAASPLLRDVSRPARVHLLWSNTSRARTVEAVCDTRDRAVRLVVKLFPDAVLKGELYHANDRLLWIEPRDVIV